MWYKGRAVESGEVKANGEQRRRYVPSSWPQSDERAADGLPSRAEVESGSVGSMVNFGPYDASEPERLWGSGAGSTSLWPSEDDATTSAAMSAGGHPEDIGERIGRAQTQTEQVVKTAQPRPRRRGAQAGAAEGGRAS